MDRTGKALSVGLNSRSLKNCSITDEAVNWLATIRLHDVLTQTTLSTSIAVKIFHRNKVLRFQCGIRRSSTAPNHIYDHAVLGIELDQRKDTCIGYYDGRRSELHPSPTRQTTDFNFEHCWRLP